MNTHAPSVIVLVGASGASLRRVRGRGWDRGCLKFVCKEGQNRAPPGGRHFPPPRRHGLSDGPASSLGQGERGGGREDRRHEGGKTRGREARFP